MTVACDEVWGKIGVYEAMEISSRCAEVTIWQEGPAEEGSVLRNKGLQRRRRRRRRDEEDLFSPRGCGARLETESKERERIRSRGEEGGIERGNRGW